MGDFCLISTSESDCLIIVFCKRRATLPSYFLSIFLKVESQTSMDRILILSFDVIYPSNRIKVQM